MPGFGPSISQNSNIVPNVLQDAPTPFAGPSQPLAQPTPQPPAVQPQGNPELLSQALLLSSLLGGSGAGFASNVGYGANPHGPTMMGQYGSPFNSTMLGNAASNQFDLLSGNPNIAPVFDLSSFSNPLASPTGGYGGARHAAAASMGGWGAPQINPQVQQAAIAELINLIVSGLGGQGAATTT